MERREDSQAAAIVDESVIYAMASSVDASAPSIAREIARHSARIRRAGRTMSIIVFHLFSSQGRADDPIELKKAQKRLLTRVSEGLRHSDCCGLYGDREIVSVLPGAALDGARSAAERVSQGKAEPPLRGTNYAIRIGVVELEADDDSVDRLLARARAAFGATR